MKTATTYPTGRLLTAALLARGYRPGAPARLPWVTQQLERTFFAPRMRCGTCGRLGMKWRPFYKGRSYRPLWCCPACGAGHENYQLEGPPCVA